ncbi:undecaprenyldiphospho-muramoylpentapeptide beta-N-acetylglucosaminyltransferase [Caldisalinibacter kiritimatiensis]|uniref:UDP-N-acetylglucosamine--N-acetylmuramyl-(pentapeptide) pyrophosphoryl-undecaprenol N-acetylglucosamine transferase n=1 Tax=Caldisalinibacter kiritimatiensis TaxID=1304284 RepID=R1CRF6_9FIRM|nr:undecaprenyldiphospho-muramoylpentapeptide beta-N-acetylglucosaminyltransferase [Caldisalinibacter kiritimatiensis]EOD01261.1 UDP-N-acetylglucosamine transferase [Caldisalinibacter kiritimatiensis]
MRFLISGGGTGGHIYPALAIAKKIKQKYKNAEILYVGTEKGLERELVPKEGFKFKTIRVKGFRRKLSVDTLKSTKELFLGLNDARKIIKDFSPDIVIGTGGYVCGPVVLIASLKNIPTLIHEQNAFPGVTNRILSRFVNKIAGSFEESKKYFKYPDKVIITGNPVRDDVITTTKEDAYKSLSIDKSKPFIYSVGGSGGQKKLNEAMLDVIEKNMDSKDVQILHVTGKRFYENFMKELKNRGIDLSDSNIRVVSYFFEAPKALAAADLVITSSGAISIAEVTAVGVPTILIPKSYTAENHQEYNARALENKGASVVILERELNGHKLNETINNLIRDKNKLSHMAVRSKELGVTDSTDRILQIIKELIVVKK